MVVSCKSRFLAVGAKHLRIKTLIVPINLGANASPFSDLCKRSITLKRQKVLDDPELFATYHESALSLALTNGISLISGC
jgi:hypothetical protein